MRKILITGASRGIGEAIALKCLSDGHKVSLGLRDPESFNKSKLANLNSYKENLISNYYDALDKDSSNSYVENTVKEFGGVDTLILCAGIFKNTKLIFPDKKIGEIEELWAINVLAPWVLTKKAWKYLKDSGIGRIQVLVSMSGKRSKGNLAGYTMSKFALMGLCQTMRNEGWESGIRVTAICPGWVNTKMSSNVTAMRKEAMTQPNDIATLSSTLLNLPNSSVPFEISINCKLEKI